MLGAWRLSAVRRLLSAILLARQVPEGRVLGRRAEDAVVEFDHVRLLDQRVELGGEMRAAGGIADSQMVGDTEAAVKWMRAQPDHNGKVGLFGSCSGGRHAFLYACQRKDIDACAELWGGRVVMGKEELNAKTPTPPIDMTKDLCCPLLGLFGNEDRAPSPEQVNQHEAELRKHGKTYEFHRYDGAGHGFFYWHRPLYRPEQAMDGWGKVFEINKTQQKS